MGAVGGNYRVVVVVGDDAYADIVDRHLAGSGIRVQRSACGTSLLNGSAASPGADLVIIDSGIPVEDVHHSSFGTWTCVGGASDGQVCEPTAPSPRPRAPGQQRLQPAGAE